MIVQAPVRLYFGAFVSLLWILAGSLVFSSSVLADKQNDLRKEIRSLKSSLEKNARRLSVVEQELEDLDKSIAKSSTNIVTFKDKIREERLELEKVRREQTLVGKQRASHDQRLNNHIRSMYMIGRQPTIKLVLNQESPAKLGRLLKYYEYFNNAYIQEITLLSQQQSRLETISSRLEQHTQRLSDLLEKHQRNRREYEQKRTKRQSIVAKLRRKQEHTRNALDHLLADQKNLERLANQMGDLVERRPISLSSGIGFAKLKGSLPWPVKGRLLARFGRSRLGSGQLSWRGLLIKADEGDEVYNVADGRVVFSDWLRGYGYVVIVDHGNDYLTLYGHNQALFRDVGESVKKGDILALVGQTGSNNTPALYFEIRHKGDPVNPQRWIQARR